MKLIRNGLFWVIIGFFILACVMHYSELFGIPSISYPSERLGLTRHAADRFLFLVPIILATYLFRRKGGLIVAFSALAAMLPRAILISPAPTDALVETGIAVAIGITASWGIWTRAEEKDRTRAALLRLESAHKILQQNMQTIEKNERRQTILNTIAAILAESLESKRILKKATILVSELMECDATLIFSLDEEKTKLDLIAYEGITDEFARIVDGTKVGEGYYGEVALIRQPAIVDDVTNDPRLTLPPATEMGIRTQLIAPMIFREHLSGILCVAARRPREFTLEDMELLTAVGTQIAMAMENSSLYEKERLIAQQLAVSERNYRKLFEDASDAIMVHDLEGNMISANDAALKLTGYSIEELSNLNVSQLFKKESMDLASHVMRSLMEKKPVKQPYEQRLIKKGGIEAILMVASSLVTEAEKPKGFQHIARDVTEQKKAEEMLAKTINGSPLPTFAINQEHKVTHWNTAIEALSGIKKEEIIGTDQSWKMFYRKPRPSMADLIVNMVDADDIRQFYQDKAKPSPLIEGAYEAEDFFPDIGESGKWLHFVASPIRDNYGKIIGAIETLRDVSEEKEMQERLRYYLNQITKAQEDERKRIARELHDDTSQNLYALFRKLDNYIRDNEDISPDNIAILKGMRQQLNRTLEEIRRFTQELRPPMLDDLGLLAALRWQISDFEKRTDTMVDFEVLGQERRFSADEQLMIFRIAQEALRNIEKHAHASKVAVGIEFGEHDTRILIADNGSGFSFDTDLAELPRLGKLGLAGMQERVNLLNGSMSIEAKPGKGTKITVDLPI